MTRLLIIVYCTLSAVNAAYSIDTLFIDQTFKHKKIEGFGYVHKSAKPKLSIDSILQFSSEDFLPFHQTGITLPPINPTYLATAIFKNETDTTLNLIFEIQNGSLDYLQFFIQNAQQLDSSSIMGVPYPFETRPIPHRNFLYPIQLAPHEAQQLYVYMKSRGQIVLFDAHLSSASDFHKKDKQQTFGWIIYFGVLLCICVLGLVTALISFNKAIIYFALYCIFGTNLVLFTSGIGLEYIWKSFEQSIFAGGYINLIPMLVAFLGLTSTFLNTAVHLPRIHKVIGLLQLILIFVFFPVTAAKYYISDLTIITFTYLGQLLQLVIIITVITASIQTYRKTKQSTALAFLMSFMFFLASMVYYSLTRVSNIIMVNEFFRYTIYFAWLIDMLFLMSLLAYKIKSTYISNLQLQQQLTTSQLSAANALLKGQREERHRLSQELHDGISIQIALFKMQLNRYFGEKSKEEVQIVNTLNNISADIRAFTHAISPINLKEETLEDAFEDLIYRIEHQTELAINLQLNKFNEKKLFDNQKIALYQVIQELINNTIKHAKASTITIQLKTLRQKTILHYADNGIGFNSTQKHQGIGLANIKARADLLQGTLDITSNKNGSSFKFILKH